MVGTTDDWDESMIGAINAPTINAPTINAPTINDRPC
jgi:hypothetical protein